MAKPSLSEIIFRKNASSRKFLSLFMELILVGSQMINFIRKWDDTSFEKMRFSADELIEKWDSLVLKIVFLNSSKATSQGRNKKQRK